VLVRVLQTLQLSILGGIPARRLVPRTPVLVRVLQTLQMSILGGIPARLLVPRTPALVRVLQTLQMSITGGFHARLRVPRIPERARLYEKVQPPHGGARTRHSSLRILFRSYTVVQGGDSILNCLFYTTSPRLLPRLPRARLSNAPELHSCVSRESMCEDAPPIIALDHSMTFSSAIVSYDAAIQ